MQVVIQDKDGHTIQATELQDDLHVPTGGSVAIYVEANGPIINMRQSTWDKCVVGCRVMSPTEITKALM